MHRPCVRADAHRGRRPARRAGDHRDDVCLVRRAHRAEAQPARRRHRRASTTPPRTPASTTRRRWGSTTSSPPSRSSATAPPRPPRRERPLPTTGPARATPTSCARRLLVSLALTLPVVVLAMVPGLAVHVLAVALGDPRRARRRLGRAGLPPRGLDQPAPRRRHHGHPGLGGHARRARLVVLRPVPRRRRDAGDDATGCSLTAAGGPTRSTSRPRRRSRRSCWPGAGSRPAPSAGPATRCAPCSTSARRTSPCAATGARSASRSTGSGVGDEFVVRPGETVATDGVVVEGRSAVDASAMTGESVPVDVGPGRRGQRRRRSRSAAAWWCARPPSAPTPAWPGSPGGSRRPRTARPRSQRLADRVSGVFVPVVIALALGTLAVWLLARGGGVGGVHRGRRRPHHRLPLRAGAGDADRADGRHRARRPARASCCAGPRCSSPPAGSTPSCSTRPAP